MQFAAGSDELDGAAQKTLDTLAAALKERRCCAWKSEGMSAAASDGPLLAEQRLEQQYQSTQYKILKSAARAKVPATTPEELVVEEGRQGRAGRASPHAYQSSSRQPSGRSCRTKAHGENAAPPCRSPGPRANCCCASWAGAGSQYQDYLVERGGPGGPAHLPARRWPGSGTGQRQVTSALHLGVCNEEICYSSRWHWPAAWPRPVRCAAAASWSAKVIAPSRWSLQVRQTRTHRSDRYTGGYCEDREMVIEEWVYGPTNSMLSILTFQNNRLTRIETKRADPSRRPGM